MTREEDGAARLAPAGEEAIEKGARILREGGLVAFPTETVYGLGADATSAEAVAKIFSAKGRPSFNPLITHVADLGAARREAELPPAALRLADAFWPGPLTLVAPRAAGGSVCDLARAGLASVALRAPSAPVARALILAAGRPIAAPSANRSGHVSPVTAAHVLDDLGESVDLVIDGGRAERGVESTIVSFLDEKPRLLRPGALAREALEEVLGAPLEGEGGEATIVAPGMTASHYAPRARLRLDASALREGEAGLDFGGRLGASEGPRPALDLSPNANLEEAAANLFLYLRRLDALGATAVAVAPIPSRGLGETINDRLRRAAAPK
ncbi:threonylcarbamoyl-AMP synthase [Methylosinus sp. H3A]|uniref:L-threonylcarbamoyladenylate synthase n=1 Tax=Methylosinus sp. H3A TaxID=2785786 RepID=UPI0018C2ED54|nr:L-threonylcarbamoyladenylate synthase [Methylosinus sp. H3A]MBG0811134.1 threonylcarbamoyl-AMP synthase [Methylosinus sp. H3A]